MLGNFDGSVLGKSACEIAWEVAGWAGLGLVLGNCRGSMHRKSVRGVPTKKSWGKVVPTIPRHTIMWKRLLSPWANEKSRP